MMQGVGGSQQEMTLREWCDRLPSQHLVNVQLYEVLLTLKHARPFIDSRETMHRDGVALYDSLLARLDLGDAVPEYKPPRRSFWTWLFGEEGASL